MDIGREVGRESGRIAWLHGAPHGAREVTIYVKGFLFGGERPDCFAPWVASHRALVDRHGWDAAAGWIWQPDGLGAVPLPLAAATRFAWDAYRATRLARSFSPLSHIGLAAAEIAGRFVVQYAHAVWAAEASAARLAETIAELRGLGADVRLVAHSLGCLSAIHASARLAPELRPRKVHLLAPACVEDALAERLADLARERTFLYFCPDDPVLAFGFKALSLRSALGAVGPRREYSRLVPVDARPWVTGFRAHGEYKHRLAELVSAQLAALSGTAADAVARLDAAPSSEAAERIAADLAAPELGPHGN